MAGAGVLVCGFASVRVCKCARVCVCLLCAACCNRFCNGIGMLAKLMIVRNFSSFWSSSFAGLDFVGVPFDVAFRKLLTNAGFFLPGESQKIGRIAQVPAVYLLLFGPPVTALFGAFHGDCALFVVVCGCLWYASAAMAAPGLGLLCLSERC